MPKDLPTEETATVDTIKANGEIYALKTQARTHQASIESFDAQIDVLVKQRTGEKAKLRAITSKIVTLQLKSDSANG